MAEFILSPNMNLPVPIVGVAPGPNYATDVNNCFSSVDSHDHSSGKGVQVTPSGLNISSDLSIQTNNLTSVRSLRFNPQLSVLPGMSPDLGCLYEVSPDLYYNDGLGNQIRITQNGGVAGGNGSIANLTPPASAAYSSGTSTFIWQSNANTAANMDMGSITLRELTPSSNGITISPPTGLAADYNITLLPSLPGSTSFLTIDNAGNLSTISTSGGINGSSITDNTVTRQKLTAVGQQISASCGASFFGFSALYQQIPNLSVSLTTTGRPVILMIQPDGISDSFVQLNGSPQNFVITFFRDSTNIREFGYNFFPVSGTYQDFLNIGCVALDAPAAGTYTYTAQIRVANNNGVTVFVNNYVLTAYEL